MNPPPEPGSSYAIFIAYSTLVGAKLEIVSEKRAWYDTIYIKKMKKSG